MIHLSCYHQLLEDVEDILSCTTFEEDSLSRKLNCKISTINIVMFFLLFNSKLTDILSLMCFLNEGDSTSCWVKLNMEALKKEYQIVQSRRLALGKTNVQAALCWFLCLHTWSFVTVQSFGAFFCPLFLFVRDA